MRCESTGFDCNPYGESVDQRKKHLRDWKLAALPGWLDFVLDFGDMRHSGHSWRKNIYFHPYEPAIFTGGGLVVSIRDDEL